MPLEHSSDLSGYSVLWEGVEGKGRGWEGRGGEEGRRGGGGGGGRVLDVFNKEGERVVLVLYVVYVQ